MPDPDRFIPIPPQALTGPRVRLRPWSDADSEPFAALNADAEVMRYFPATLSRLQSDELMADIQRRMALRGWGLWALEIAGDADGVQAPQFIGFTGLNIPAASLPFSPCVEVGWRLARPWWGKGLASEAAHLALQVGFHNLGLPEIVAFTTLANLRSRAVMRRLRMTESRADAFEHPGVPLGSPLRPHCLYRLSRARWADQTTPSPDN
ncbi:MAG TPA: GNAT family N-acetyltransferase [Ramlibacter sp.]|nr:GNAT family N-acetyltransferase [Ramlibacter sp.]